MQFSQIYIPDFYGLFLPLQPNIFSSNCYCVVLLYKQSALEGNSHAILYSLEGQRSKDSFENCAKFCQYTLKRVWPIWSIFFGIYWCKNIWRNSFLTLGTFQLILEMFLKAGRSSTFVMIYMYSKISLGFQVIIYFPHCGFPE